MKSSRAARIAAGVLLGLSLLSQYAVPPAARSVSGALTFLGYWADAGFGAVVPDPAVQGILTIANTPTGARVSAFTGNRVALGQRALDPLLVGAGSGDPVVYALDGPARRLYLIAYPSTAERQAAVNPHLVVVDLTDPHAMKVVSDRALTVFPPEVRTVGLSRSNDGRLQLLGQASINGVRAFGVFVAEIDPRGATIATTAGPSPVRGCENVISSSDPAALARIGTIVYFGCATTKALDNSVPGSPAVLGVDLTSAASPASYFLPGTYGQAESYFDPAAGDDGRLLLVGSSAGKPGQAVWVFDIRHRVMVGQIGAGEIYGGGINPLNGRLYISINGALMESLDRGRAIPQAVRHDDVQPVRAPIRVIPFNRTIIVLVTNKSNQLAWAVYRDDTRDDLFVAAPAESFIGDDARTTTAPQFEGDAQAFGVRVHDMGGANALLTNSTGQSLAWWAPVALASGLKDGDRDVHFAQVLGAHLSADEASGAGITMNRDQNTADDFVTLKQGAWPFSPAVCADFGDQPASTNGANPAWASGTAPSAACNGHDGKVTVSAEYDGAGVPGVATAGSSFSTARLTHDAAGALAVVSRAEAHDVVLGRGTVTIGAIISEATVTAFGGTAGTKGRAAASYARRFEHVTAPGFSCESVCPPDTVLATISNALGAQFQVELPSFDALATAGGSHAHAWRDPWQHQQDVVLISQPLTEIQVPALRVSYVGDYVLPSRLVVEFSATKADATSIFLAVAHDEPVAATGDSLGATPVVAAGVVDSASPSLPLFAAPMIPPVTAPAPSLASRLVRIPARPVRWLLDADPGAVAVWLVFLTPLFLAARRRHLLRVGQQS